MWSLTKMGIELRALINTKCRASGLTLSQAAETLPITPGELHRIVACSEMPTVEQFRALCRWLEISADDLLGLQDRK